MKREVIDCDVCKEESNPVIHINIPNGISYEYGGHKTETYFDYEKKDLCCECAEKLLNFLFGHKKVIRSTQTNNFVDKSPLLPGFTEEWLYTRHAHPSAETNDAVDLALKFFKIKPKK